MTEQLYIDGQLMDMAEGGDAIELVYQSPYFTELDAVVSNRTNEITLPLTERNRAALGWLGTQGETDFPYRHHRAIYRRDGVQLLYGEAIVHEVSADGVSLSLVWGNSDVYRALFDLQLRDLMHWDEQGDYLNMDVYQADEMQKFTASQLNVWSGYLLRPVPVLPAVYITERLKEDTGVDLGSTFSSMCIALTTMNGVDESREKESVSIPSVRDAGTLDESRLEQNLYRGFVKLKRGTAADLWGVWGADEWITTYDSDSHRFQKVTIAVDEMRYRIFDASAYVISQSVALMVWGERRDNHATEMIATLSEAPVRVGVNQWEVAVQKQSVEIDVSAYGKICVTFGLTVSATELQPLPQPTFIKDGGLKITPDVNGEYLRYYPLFANLPDISVGELLKDWMLMFGLFAWNENGQIRFVNLNDLYYARYVAMDWSAKMIDMHPDSRSYTMEGLAQRNWLRYAETDDVVPSEVDGYISCDNETLEQETDLAELNLGSVGESPFIAGMRGSVKLWEYDEENDKYVFKETKHRLLWINDVDKTRGDKAAYISRYLNLQQVVQERYAAYQQIVRRPVTLQCRMRIDVSDLVTLDLTKPVYLQQTGRYYAIMELTAVSASLADVRLLQLSGQIDVQNPFKVNVSELDGQEKLNV